MIKERTIKLEFNKWFEFSKRKKQCGNLVNFIYQTSIVLWNEILIDRFETDSSQNISHQFQSEIRFIR